MLKSPFKIHLQVWTVVFRVIIYVSGDMHMQIQCLHIQTHRDMITTERCLQCVWHQTTRTENFELDWCSDSSKYVYHHYLMNLTYRVHLPVISGSNSFPAVKIVLFEALVLHLFPINVLLLWFFFFISARSCVFSPFNFFLTISKPFYWGKLSPEFLVLNAYI